MKRRQARVKRPAKPQPVQRSTARWHLRHWLLLLAAAALPFVFGYAIAIFFLFPPPEVAGVGIVVPDLVGRNVDDARRELSALQLALGETTPLPSETADEGTILAQSPLAGQQLRAGRGVRVAVSSGRPRLLVPDVVGFPVERGAALLTRLGFQVQRVDAPSEAEPGRVLSLEPRPGSELQLPARVTITVSIQDTTRADTTVWSSNQGAPTGDDPERARWSAAPNDPIFFVAQTVAPVRLVTERHDF